jgi:hypothetical protein
MKRYSRARRFKVAVNVTFYLFLQKLPEAERKVIIKAAIANGDDLCQKNIL